MVQRVAHEVVQHPLQHGRVGVDQTFLVGVGLQRVTVFGADVLVPLGHLVAELGQVKVHHLGLFGAGADLGQVHDAVHQGAEPVGLVHNDVELLGALLGVVAGEIPQGLGVALDEGEGGAQIVADVGDQLLLQPGRAVHLPGHKVEVPGQVGHLVLAFLLHLYLVIAPGHLPGCPRQLPQGPGEDGAEDPGARQAHGQQ